MLMESKDVDGVDHLTSLETAPPDQEISDILSYSVLIIFSALPYFG